MATADARGTVLSVAWRVVRAVELLFAAVGLYGFFLQLPLVAAAASSVLRAVAALSLPQYSFLVGNAIVVVLFALFRRRADDDDDASPSPPAALLSWLWPSEGDVQADKYPPFPDPSSLMPPPPPPAITGEVGEKEIAAVFEDKKAVHVTKVRAQPPRRSKSEKTTVTGGAAAARPRRAERPELRRGESENGRQWLVAAAAAEATPVERGMDVEAFQRWIEEFIEKKKTGFHLEESAAAAKAAAAAASGVADEPAVAGAAVAVVK